MDLAARPGRRDESGLSEDLEMLHSEIVQQYSRRASFRMLSRRPLVAQFQRGRCERASLAPWVITLDPLRTGRTP